MIAVWLGGAALARSWCASPVVAHEWGVAVLRPAGGLELPTGLPPWFERSGVQPIAAPRVRDLPADNGVRTLPVVQFWRGDERPGDVPLGVEVGFTQGTAAVWWPPVDALSLWTPERQLTWEALTLSETAPARPRDTDLDWVADLRATEGALWVGRGPEAERFLFYEGRTRESPAVTVAPTDDGRLSLRNRSDWPVHDVWVVGPDGRAGGVATLAAGAEVTVRADRPVDEAWRAELRRGWVDTGPRLRPWISSGDDCVMMRDPAVPLRAASGHALYASEVDALLSVWGERLLSDRAHLLYREDPAALDAVMPVALYTDQYHWFDWKRLGLVLVEP